MYSCSCLCICFGAMKEEAFRGDEIHVEGEVPGPEVKQSDRLLDRDFYQLNRDFDRLDRDFGRLDRDFGRLDRFLNFFFWVLV